MNDYAFAGHAGDAGPGLASGLLPDELALGLAAALVGLAFLAGLIVVMLRRLSRLERRMASLERAQPQAQPVDPRPAGSSPRATPLQDQRLS